MFYMKENSVMANYYERIYRYDVQYVNDLYILGTHNQFKDVLQALS
jgi:hypothetical protein